MIILHYDHLDPEIVAQTLGVLIKDADDLERLRTETIEQIMRSVS